MLHTCLDEVGARVPTRNVQQSAHASKLVAAGLKSSLRDYQFAAIDWMVQRETTHSVAEGAAAVAAECWHELQAKVGAMWIMVVMVCTRASYVMLPCSTSGAVPCTIR